MLNLSIHLKVIQNHNKNLLFKEHSIYQTAIMKNKFLLKKSFNSLKINNTNKNSSKRFNCIKISKESMMESSLIKILSISSVSLLSLLQILNNLLLLQKEPTFLKKTQDHNTHNDQIDLDSSKLKYLQNIISKII